MNKKNYLGIIVIATAILGAMVFSSCSHDEYYYNEEKAEQTLNDKYAAAFEKAFGKVGPNVDWGFGRQPSSARALTRTGDEFQPTIDFPEDCDASKFLDALPTDENVKRLPTDGGGAFSWFIDAQTQSVSTWGASKIYVTGTVDLSNGDGDTSAQSWKFAPSIYSEIYLLKGSKLILGEASAYNLNVAAIYIAEGATLETAGFLKANNNTKVYNHGTIKVGTFEVNTTSFLYNVGTLEAESVNAESNDSRIVNDGTINCATVVVNAGAVQNNDKWIVTSTTNINSNNSGWVNNGHWTTYDYVYIAGSENVINNCFLEVTNDFEMNISSEQGAFKIDGGGGVLAKNFIGGGYSTEEAISGPFVIVMGPEAVFVVEETAKLESGRYDEEGFGIFGPSSGEYAVFQAKNIVRDPYLESINSHGAVTYGGNLYVSAESHFPQGKDSDGSGTYVPQPYIYEQGRFTLANIYAPGEDFSTGKPNITIEKTTCNPGFKGGNPLYRVIAEDLSAEEAGDFDFNDVVFDVVKAENNKTTLKLICAGGILPLRVRGADEAEGQEVHAVFGDTTPMLDRHPMYNTGKGPNAPATEFTVEGTYTTPTKIKEIIIEVYKDGQWMELTATRGKAACKILVDDTFIPVTETRNIANDYGYFTKYVQGDFVDDFWWK
jgi:hypothetical protein